jgi:hypothetical protein
MIASRNAEVAAVAVKAVEGQPQYGGDMLVKPLAGPMMNTSEPTVDFTLPFTT